MIDSKTSFPSHTLFVTKKYHLMKRKLSMLCLILALGGLTPAHAQGLDPTGTWKWNVANPDGQIPDITVTLKLKGETLAGKITRRTGTTSVTNGLFKGDQVSFQVIREGKLGKTTTTYRGKLDGDAIKGKVEIDAGGKNFSSDWEIKRDSAKL